jgi:2-keto-4-pentenoate hydratase/2-oxohepta-3-ene-1,7-dioic acid hydratase in catechol pathway
MKYVSFRAGDGYESVGILQATTVLDMGAGLGITRGGQVAGPSPIRRLIDMLEGALELPPDRLLGLPGFDIETVTILPIVPDPSKIIAAPVNYRDHQAEMSQDAHVDALGVFLKAPSSVVAAGSTVQLPYNDRRFDQEGELALVIGRRARHVTPDSALDYVAGYTCLLDLTMRGGEDRSTRKSFDGFTPVGPYLVTPDEVGPLEAVQLRTWVAGELRQHADVKDLIWSVPQLISYASSVMTLQPGDIITTGTPAGVGQIHNGDDVSVEIDRVGRLSVTISDSHAVSCPTKGANRGPQPPATVTPVRQR